MKKKVKSKKSSAPVSKGGAKHDKLFINETASLPIKPVTDVAALLDKSSVNAEAKKIEQKNKREEKKEQRKELAAKSNSGLRVVHNKHGNGSKVVNSAGDTRAVTANLPDSLKGLTNNLKEAKIATRDESAKQRRPLYINVLQDGSFDMSARYDKDSSLHCFLNGAEVAMIVPKKSAPTKIEKQDEESNTMSTTKEKTGKKVAAKKVVTVSGKAVDKTVAQVLALLKAGKTVYTSSGKGKYNAPYLSQRDKASVLSVIIK